MVKCTYQFPFGIYFLEKLREQKVQSAPQICNTGAYKQWFVQHSWNYDSLQRFFLVFDEMPEISCTIVFLVDQSVAGVLDSATNNGL